MDSKEVQWAKKLLFERRQLKFESWDDWRNGVLLLNILEIITAKKLPSKGFPNPRNRIQSIENINISFSFMESCSLMLPKCSPQDFVDGNEKSIQSIIYRLYLLSTGKTSSASFYSQPKRPSQHNRVNSNSTNPLKHSDSNDSLNSFNDGSTAATAAASPTTSPSSSTIVISPSKTLPRTTSSNEFKQATPFKSVRPTSPNNTSPNTTALPHRPQTLPPPIQILSQPLPSSAESIKKSASNSSLSSSSSKEDLLDGQDRDPAKQKRWRVVNKDRPMSGTGFNLAGSRLSFRSTSQESLNRQLSSQNSKDDLLDGQDGGSNTTPVKSQHSAWFSTSFSSADKLPKRKAYLKQIVDTERYNNPDLLPTIIQCQCIVRTWIATRIVKKRLKFNQHRNKVFKEILSSEENYMQGIEMIVNVFYQQIIFNAKVSPTPYLTQDQINTIFSTVKEIYSFNRELLTRLRERSQKWDHRQKIGDIFVLLAPYLKLYKTYCLNYDAAIECLQQAKKNETFKLFIKACLDHPENNMKQSLESLLITIVQRIPRYILLLQDFYRHTWSDHCDYENLGLALKNVQQIANEVNSSIKMSESQSKVLQIQTSLIGWDEETLGELVRPSRHFIKQGLVYLCQLDQRFQKDKLELVCFYFNDALLLAEKKDKDKYQFKFFFETALLRVKDVEDSAVIQNAIHLICNETTAFLSLHTQELKRSMIDFIEKSKPRGARPLTVDWSEASTATPNILNNNYYTVQIKKTESKKLPGKKPFTVYYIDILNETTGEQHTIEKRYSDFDTLNNKLKKKFSDSNLKELPKKHLLNNLGSNTVESRRIMLELYLQDVFQKENIKNSRYLLHFINPKASLQKAGSESSMSAIDEAFLSSSSLQSQLPQSTIDGTNNVDDEEDN